MSKQLREQVSRKHSSNPRCEYEWKQPETKPARHVFLKRIMMALQFKRNLKVSETRYRRISAKHTPTILFRAGHCTFPGVTKQTMNRAKD